MKIAVVVQALVTFGATAKESWTIAGEKNVGTLLKLNEVAKELQGKQITESLVAKLSQDMASFYAPKMSCSVGDKGAFGSFSLSDVSFADCAAAFAKLNGNLKVIGWDMENVAIDPFSGGKTLLTSQPTDVVGMTSSGVEVPGTLFHRIDSGFQYVFNEEGQIVHFHNERDSAIMETLMNRVASFSRGVAELPATGSWISVGKRNAELLLQMNDISKELQGKQMTPILMAKLSQDLASFYAPTISCSAGDKSSSMSFSLNQVPFSACTTAFAKVYSNTKPLHWDMTVAIDPASGGTKILTYQPLDFVGVTDIGVEVPGTELHGVDLGFVYTFDESGKIIRFHQQIDTGIVEGVKARVESQESLSSDQPASVNAGMFVAVVSGVLGGLAGVVITLKVVTRREEPMLLEHTW